VPSSHVQIRYYFVCHRCLLSIIEARFQTIAQYNTGEPGKPPGRGAWVEQLVRTPPCYVLVSTDNCLRDHIGRLTHSVYILTLIVCSDMMADRHNGTAAAIACMSSCGAILHARKEEKE
jgi:hypothetical protein